MAAVTFSETAAAGQAPSPGAAAYVCAKLNFRVFPLLPGVGTPALKDWPNVATTDLDQVREWWTGDHAGGGVGIACGSGSGIWVLDLDRKHGVDGFKTMRELMLARGAPLDLFTNTLTTATPNGGAHLFFRHVDGIPNSTGGTNALGPGLDVRSGAGYVRAFGWAGYAVVPRGGVRSVAVRSAPGWLVELAKTKPRHAQLPTVGETATVGSIRVLGTERALDALGSAPAGTRNDELNRAAFRLGLRGELTRDEAWNECRLILVSIGANDSEYAQLRTFESGWEGGVRKRASINTPEPEATAPTAQAKG